MSETKLFVRNLSETTTYEDLQGAFGKYGSVHTIVLFPSEGGPGYASVVFYRVEEAQNALVNTDGMMLNGRTIGVKRH